MKSEKKLKKEKRKLLKSAKGFFLNCCDRYVDDEEIRVHKGEVIRIPVKRFIQGSIIDLSEFSNKELKFVLKLFKQVRKQKK